LFDKKKVLFTHDLPHPVNYQIEHADWIPTYETYQNGEFRFLNKTKSFDGTIDWNFKDFGMLWAYNLNYFEYLLQPSISRETGLKYINHFIENIESNTVGLDPYPISLRTINWIKFCLKFEVQDSSFLYKSLYGQLLRLKENIEYHILGNHLLENGCALFIGGIYFQDQNLLKRGKKILQEQLNEQILSDGGHYERSPMYHQILLSRLLDCYNLAKHTKLLEPQFTAFLKGKVKLMLGWLYSVTFRDGTIPKVNDAADGIAPSTKDLRMYARRLGIEQQETELGESGYVQVKAEKFEWFIDVGNVGPDYIPGHAHSDTFSFILHVHDKPVIVDTGISTYEECDRRVEERSTAAHNTVKINEIEQTEVWKSFRVGRRAKVTNVQMQSHCITAWHNGYEHIGVIHERTFKWQSDSLTIEDELKRSDKFISKAYIHFHPRVNVSHQDDTIIADDITILIEGAEKVEIKSYKYAAGFNQLQPARVLELTFRQSLKTRIII
jgi:hypothetical protein